MAANNLIKVIFFDNQRINFSETLKNNNREGEVTGGGYYQNGIYFSPPLVQGEGHILHNGKVYTLGTKFISSEEANNTVSLINIGSGSKNRISSGIENNKIPYYDGIKYDRVEKTITGNLKYLDINSLVLMLNSLDNEITELKGNMPVITIPDCFKAVTNIKYNGNQQSLLQQVNLDSSILFKYSITFGENITAPIEFTDVRDIKGTNAGYYPITIQATLKNSLSKWNLSNTLPTGVTVSEDKKTVIYTITSIIKKGQLSLSGITISDKTQSGVGTRVWLITADEAEKLTTNGTVEYGLTSGNYTTSNPLSLYVEGDLNSRYTIYYKITPTDTNNYDISTGQFTVNVTPFVEQINYYYYAGWQCPTTETELANLAIQPNGEYIGTTLGTYTKTNPLRLYDGELVNSTKLQYYIVIPNNISIYDSEGDATLMDIFDEQSSTIPNHKVYKSQTPMKGIGGIMLR